LLLTLRWGGGAACRQPCEQSCHWWELVQAAQQRQVIRRERRLCLILQLHGSCCLSNILLARLHRWAYSSRTAHASPAEDYIKNAEFRRVLSLWQFHCCFTATTGRKNGETMRQCTGRGINGVERRWGEVNILHHIGLALCR
jgi:hypothetical protein